MIIFLFFTFLPPIAPLSPVGMKAIGIIFFTIICWGTLGIGYPSLITILLIVFTGILSPTEAFAASWGGWLVLFMLGSFGICESLKLTGFPRRFALWFIAHPFCAGHPWRLVSMFLLSCALMGGIMPRSATTVIFLTIAIPLLEVLGFKKGDSIAAMLVMGIPWTATAAAVMTSSGHPANLLMMGFLQRDFMYNISNLRWMAFGIPIGLLAFLMILGFFRYIIRPDLSKVSRLAGEYSSKELTKMGPLKFEEKLVLGIFLGVIILWLLPNILTDILPSVSNYLTNMGYAVPPLLGACLMCVLRINKRPLLTFRDWMGGVEWPTISLVATIGILLKVMELEGTGIIEFLTNLFSPVAQIGPWYIILFIISLWTMLQGNMTATLATVTLVYNVMAPLVVASGQINPVALGLVITVASNFIFILPSSSANAIAVGSGWVSVDFMIRCGIIMIVPAILFLSLVCYPLACIGFS